MGEALIVAGSHAGEALAALLLLYPLTCIAARGLVGPLGAWRTVFGFFLAWIGATLVSLMLPASDVASAYGFARLFVLPLATSMLAVKLVARRPGRLPPPPRPNVMSRVRAFVLRHRELAAVGLLMLGVALIADAYTPAYGYGRARLDLLELALGVGALALAWIVYRGPRR